MSSSPTKEKTINMVTGVTSAIDCISIEPQCRPHRPVSRQFWWELSFIFDHPHTVLNYIYSGFNAVF